MDLSFAVLGGDSRQRELARLLREDGFAVITVRVPGEPDFPGGFPTAVRAAQAVVLPMPASCAPDALDAALRFAAPGTRIFGGMLPPAPDAAQLRLYDYAKDEALLLENAALTADAAAQLLQQRLPRPLSASRVLLCGFGRIGKLLARSLVRAGAAVTVSARRPADFALCRILGLPCVKTGVFAPADGFDAIVNTVPAQILPDSYVSAAAPGCVLLELASSPGGFGSQAQKRPGYVCARGLPGRYAPHAAAACIHDAILRTLSPEERL